MKHNTNDHSNAVYFALLNLADDGTYSITHVEINGPDKFIHIEKHLRPTFCPSCNARMHSKGIYTRRVNHPITQDSMNIYLIVHQRRWICKSCGHTENDSFPFLDKYSHSSNITPYLILDAFRNLSRSTADIAAQFNISDSSARLVFKRYVDLPRLPLPEYISVDEVYLNISNKDKYAFVIMDFVSGEIIDIVHNRWRSTIEDYFLSIPLKERLNVKGVISDAYRTYLKLPEDFFPHALTILDSFHVIKLIISRINTYIYKVLKRYKKRDEERRKQKNHDENRDSRTIRPSREVILLQNYKWVILKNQDDINYSTKRYYHKMLSMNVDTFAIEKMFLDLDPNFKKLRDLKEEYIEFNEQDYADEFDVLSSLNTLIDKYRRSDQSIFRDFALFLRSNTDPIVNSFIKVKVHRKSASGEKEYYARLSNGPMESFNRKPKDLKRESRGFSDFDYTRNRILWATRENPSVKGIPRSKEEIKTNEGKERDPYKKKKQSSSK